MRGGLALAACGILAALVAAGCGAQTAALAKAPGAKAEPLAVGHSVRASFKGQPSPSWVLQQVAMATPEVGYATANTATAGEVAEALVTRDGGASFRLAFTAPVMLVGVAAPDPGYAYFLESDGLGGGDGFRSALELLPGAAGAPRTLWRRGQTQALSLSFPSAEDGYIAAVVGGTTSSPGRPTLFVTHDGGGNFAALPLPQGCGDTLAGGSAVVSFADAQDGWLLCGGQPGAGMQPKTLDRSPDGGAHWTTVAATSPQAGEGRLSLGGYVSSLDAVAGGQLYIGLARGGVLASQDGGRSWRQVYAQEAGPGSDAVPSLGLGPGGLGWLLAGSQGNLYLTRDGGKDWRLTYPPLGPDEGLFDLGAGRAVGISSDSGLLGSSDGGAHWQAIAPAAPPLAVLDAPSARNLVGASGAVLWTSHSGGAHWSRAGGTAGWTVRDIGYSSGDQGWVVAQQGFGPDVLFACRDSGCERLRATFEPLLAQATGAETGFAAGFDRRGRLGLFTTADGGRSWQEALIGRFFAPGGAPPDLRGIGRRGKVDWLYGQSAAIVSRDSGATWAEISYPQAPGPVASLSFSDARHGLLVTSLTANATTVWRTADGGQVFDALP